MISFLLWVVIIGVGQVVDKVYVLYYCICNDLELVVVCDSCFFQVQVLVEKYGNVFVWDDLQVMLLVVKFDVVSVCLFNCFYYEYILMVLEVGCYVMCEKLFVMMLEQVWEMCDIVCKLGKVLVYDFYYCFVFDM